MQKAWVPFLGWEDPLGKGTPEFWPGEFLGLYCPWGRTESDRMGRLSKQKCPFIIIWKALTVELVVKRVCECLRVELSELKLVWGRGAVLGGHTEGQINQLWRKNIKLNFLLCPSIQRASLKDLKIENIKGWCGSWNSNTLTTWCKQLTHWKRPWCWERLGAGEGDDRGWDAWMSSPTRWT